MVWDGWRMVQPVAACPPPRLVLLPCHCLPSPGHGVAPQLRDTRQCYAMRLQERERGGAVVLGCNSVVGGEGKLELGRERPIHITGT